MHQTVALLRARRVTSKDCGVRNATEEVREYTMNPFRKRLVALIAFWATALLSGRALAQASPQQPLQAHLSADTNTARQGESIRFRVEIENVSDHIILVGRDPKMISNWPFRMDIQLEDASGKQIDKFGGGYLDPPPMADLAIKDGVLEWWMPLAPHIFMGRYVTIPFTDFQPGRYRLSFKYVSIRPHSPSEETPEQRAIAAKFSVFDGTVSTNFVPIEVVPKD
jgi:hypothetical protein